MPELDQPRKLDLEPLAKSSLVLPEIYKLETRKVRIPTPRLLAGFIQSLKIFRWLVFEKWQRIRKQELEARTRCRVTRDRMVCAWKWCEKKRLEKLVHGTRWSEMEGRATGRSSIGRAWRGADSTKLKLQISQERNEWYLFFIYLSTWLSSDLNKWSLVVLMFFVERSRFLL